MKENEGRNSRETVPFNIYDIKKLVKKSKRSSCKFSTALEQSVGRLYQNYNGLRDKVHILTILSIF
jgi:hypothetical protein